MIRQETSDGDLLLIVHDVALDERHPAPGHAGHEGGAAGPGAQLPLVLRHLAEEGWRWWLDCFSHLSLTPKVEPALKGR